MTANISLYSNVTNLGQVMTITNDASGGWLANGWLISFFVIMLIVVLSRGRDTRALILVDSFLTFLQAFLLLLGGWVRIETLYFTIALFVLSLLFFIFGEE